MQARPDRSGWPATYFPPWRRRLAFDQTRDSVSVPITPHRFVTREGCSVSADAMAQLVDLVSECIRLARDASRERRCD